MPPTKTQRWLDLLALLVGRRLPLSVDEIMEQIPAYRARWEGEDRKARESVRRMFERDKGELRRMGIPLETIRYRVEGHQETEGYLIPRRGFYLPYLHLVAADAGDVPEGPGGGRPAAFASDHAIGRVTLGEADARAAIQALREVLSLPSFPFRREARTVLRKLTFDLDPALGSPEEGEGGGDPVVRILDRPGGADPSDVLGLLLDALYDRRRVRFRYHSIGRDAVEAREVEPWGLLFQWGAWYLAARDPEKEGEGEGPDARLFRVDRMRDARLAHPKGTGAEFQVPAGFDIRAYAGRKAWELEGKEDPEMEVLVRFLPPTSLLAARNAWGELLEEKSDGSAVRRLRVRRLDPFLRWLLSLAGEARVDAPAEAREAFARSAREVLELYREAR